MCTFSVYPSFSLSLSVFVSNSLGFAMTINPLSIHVLMCSHVYILPVTLLQSGKSKMSHTLRQPITYTPNQSEMRAIEMEREKQQ